MKRGDESMRMSGGKIWDAAYNREPMYDLNACCWTLLSVSIYDQSLHLLMNSKISRHAHPQKVTYDAVNSLYL